MSLNTHLNAFLALLEQRPEAARNIFGSLPQPVPRAEISRLEGRISQAVENVKCQAIKDAIRTAFNDTLRLRGPQGTLMSQTPEFETQEAQEEAFLNAQKEAYWEGVQAVEDILGRIIRQCEETEKRLGTPDQALS